MLLDPRGSDDGEGRHEVLPTTLVVRRSCGSKPPRLPGSPVRWERRRAIGMTPRRGLKT
jgi:hypothetical protein